VGMRVPPDKTSMLRCRAMHCVSRLGRKGMPAAARVGCCSPKPAEHWHRVPDSDRECPGSQRLPLAHFMGSFQACAAAPMRCATTPCCSTSINARNPRCSSSQPARCMPAIDRRSQPWPCVGPWGQLHVRYEQGRCFEARTHKAAEVMEHVMVAGGKGSSFPVCCAAVAA